MERWRVAQSTSSTSQWRYTNKANDESTQCELGHVDFAFCGVTGIVGRLFAAKVEVPGVQLAA